MSDFFYDMIDVRNSVQTDNPYIVNNSDTDNILAFTSILFVAGTDLVGGGGASYNSGWVTTFGWWKRWGKCVIGTVGSAALGALGGGGFWGAIIGGMIGAARFC